MMPLQLVLIEAQSLRYSVYSQFSAAFPVKLMASYIAEAPLDSEYVELLRTDRYFAEGEGGDA